MNFSGNATHDPLQESLRLSVMFVLALIGASIGWFILRRTGQGLAGNVPLPPSQRLKRLLLVGIVSLLCFGSGALVYYSDGPREKVTVISGNPITIGFLPISQWGFGVSELEIIDQRSEREAGCTSEIDGVRFCFGFLEYRNFTWPPPCVAES